MKIKNFTKRYKPQPGQYLLECACKSFHGILEFECPIRKQTKSISQYQVKNIQPINL